MSRIDSAVTLYRRENKPKLDQLLAWYAELPTLERAIWAASHGLDQRERRHPHQRRLKKDALDIACAALLARVDDITAAMAFEELLRVVAEEAGRIRGLGPLYVYDTALRIGAKRSVFPADVYLHAGTRAGAKAIGIDPRRETITVAELPEPFRVLSPHEVEDVLCIYKGLLSKA